MSIGMPPYVRRRASILLAALLGCSASGSAWAQTLPALHGSPIPPQGSPLPGIAPPRLPGVAPGAATPPAALPGAVNPNLSAAISQATVEGATAYSPASMAQYTLGLTGPAVPVSRIEAARTAIVNRYRADGYVYTAVNARITKGHLRLTVIESRIVSVKLRGNIGPAGTQVLRFLNHLLDVAPITNAAIERWLLLANDIPGVSVHSIINPSSTDPGALTLVAEVSREPFAVTLKADNRAFRQTGPEELLSVLDLNSFTSFGERSELSIYHTFNNTDTFGQFSEDLFLGGSGLKLHLYGGDGESQPSGSLRQLGYDGITRVFGGALSYPLIRSRAQTLNLSALFDGVESDIAYDVARKPVRASFDSLRVLRGEAQYVLLDTWLSDWFGPGFSANDFAELGVSQGLPAFGASSNGNPQLPRLNERVDFTKVDAEFDRTQILFSPFPGGVVSVLVGLQGQFTNNILPPEEEDYLGGPNFGRGFYYGEVTGDRALQAKFEPRLDMPLPALSFLSVPITAQFYAFYDWGETWQQQALDADHRLRSLGGGVRLFAGRYAEIDLEGVSRLTRTPDGNPPEVSRLQSSAFYWQVLLHY